MEAPLRHRGRVHRAAGRASRAAARDHNLTQWLETGRIRHALGRDFPLERIAEAHEPVEQGRVIGNVVVRP